MDIYGEADQAARLASATAALRELATVLAAFRDALLEYGFSRDEALSLCAEYLVTVVTPDNG